MQIRLKFQNDFPYLSVEIPDEMLTDKQSIAANIKQITELCNEAFEAEFSNYEPVPKLEDFKCVERGANLDFKNEENFQKALQDNLVTSFGKDSIDVEVFPKWDSKYEVKSSDTRRSLEEFTIKSVQQKNNIDFSFGIAGSNKPYQTISVDLSNPNHQKFAQDFHSATGRDIRDFEKVNLYSQKYDFADPKVFADAIKAHEGTGNLAVTLESKPSHQLQAEQAERAKKTGKKSFLSSFIEKRDSRRASKNTGSEPGSAVKDKKRNARRRR